MHQVRRRAAVQLLRAEAREVQAGRGGVGQAEAGIKAGDHVAAAGGQQAVVLLAEPQAGLRGRQFQAARLQPAAHVVEAGGQRPQLVRRAVQAADADAEVPGAQPPRHAGHMPDGAEQRTVGDQRRQQQGGAGRRRGDGQLRGQLRVRSRQHLVARQSHGQDQVAAGARQRREARDPVGPVGVRRFQRAAARGVAGGGGQGRVATRQHDRGGGQALPVHGVRHPCAGHRQADQQAAVADVDDLHQVRARPRQAGGQPAEPVEVHGGNQHALRDGARGLAPVRRRRARREQRHRGDQAGPAGRTAHGGAAKDEVVGVGRHRLREIGTAGQAQRRLLVPAVAGHPAVGAGDGQGADALVVLLHPAQQGVAGPVMDAAHVRHQGQHAQQGGRFLDHVVLLLSPQDGQVAGAAGGGPDGAAPFREGAGQQQQDQRAGRDQRQHGKLRPDAGQRPAPVPHDAGSGVQCSVPAARPLPGWPRRDP